MMDRNEIEYLNPVVLPVDLLEEKVWNRQLCSGCRSCIAVCLADSLAYDHERNHPQQVNPCIDCQACLIACPRLPENCEPISSSEDIIGPYLAVKNIRSKIRYARHQNGGGASALLAAALDEELVDCALVMGLDRWSHLPHPRVVYDSRDLGKSAGSKYTSNEILESVKDLVKEPQVKNIALVGTPCSVQAVGLLRRSDNEYAAKLAGKVRFLLGLFCFEAFDSSAISRLESAIGSGCADFTAKRSDISLGAVGSAPGMSSAVVRTAEGLGLFSIAEEMGYIESWDGVKLDAIENVGKIKLKKHREKSRPCL